MEPAQDLNKVDLAQRWTGRWSGRTQAIMAASMAMFAWLLTSKAPDVVGILCEPTTSIWE